MYYLEKAIHGFLFLFSLLIKNHIIISVIKIETEALPRSQLHNKLDLFISIRIIYILP